MRTLLLTTDLDRTLLPNGPQTEDPGVRERFARLVRREECVLVYVTGRHLASVESAIQEYGLPIPDHAICDVGTTIHGRMTEESGADEEWSWRILDSWRDRLRELWSPAQILSARQSLASLPELVLQEEERQASFKLSYYLSQPSDVDVYLQELRRRLTEHDLHPKLVYSVDELSGRGLLDLLPPDTGKRAAIEFLMHTLDLEPGTSFFAGDSGNDMEVLVSPIPSVLVANASPAVREHALRESERLGHGDRLHLARGGYHGMNGNYAAGILEGLARFWPETEGWWS